MSTKQGGKLKPLKKPKSDKKDYDENNIGIVEEYVTMFLRHVFLKEKDDMANMQKKRDEEKALKELKAKASQKGTFGGTGLKKSGKK